MLQSWSSQICRFHDQYQCKDNLSHISLLTFPGSRGLREGHPLLPYLFVLVMVAFLGLMDSMTRRPNLDSIGGAIGRKYPIFASLMTF